MNNSDKYKALLVIVIEYAEGRGPLVKFKDINNKLIKLAKQDSTLFRVLGFNR